MNKTENFIKKISGSFHCLIICVFQVFYIFIINHNELNYKQLQRPILFICGIIFIVTILLSLTNKNKFKRLAVILTIAQFLIFNYGFFSWYITSLIDEENFSGLFIKSIERHFFILWLMLQLIICCIVYSKLNNNLIQKINSFLTRTALILFLLLSYQFLQKNAMFYNNYFSDKNIENSKITTENNCFKPDIILIVLDAYSNKKILKKVYNFDNSDFLNKLKDNDFNVMEESESNYQSTYLSINSLFKMDYLDFNKSNDFSFAYFSENLKNSAAYKFLKTNGYTTATFSPYLSTSFHLDFFDNLYSYAIKGNINSFERILINNSLLSKLFESSNSYYYKKINYELDTLENFGNIKKQNPDTPVFFYAHIESPHPPFVFDENGKQTKSEKITEGDGDFIINTIMTADEYREKYIKQVEYLNKKTENIISNLIDMDTKPVIILMSDHGPRSILNKNDDNYILEKISNLYAIYLPEKIIDVSDTCDISIKPIFTKTPVNTFRTLFNYYFDADYEMLPDKTIWFNSDFTQNDISDYFIFYY